MKIGLFPACLGKNDAGPETYERELIAHIATLAGDPHEYHVYCFNAAARQAVNGQSRRLNVHTLWPGLRAASMGLSLPWLLARHGVRVYHATFVPAPFCSTPAARHSLSRVGQMAAFCSTTPREVRNFRSRASRLIPRTWFGREVTLKISPM